MIRAGDSIVNPVTGETLVFHQTGAGRRAAPWHRPTPSLASAHVRVPDPAAERAPFFVAPRYRKSDVEVTLAQFGLTVEQQHHELDSLRRRAEEPGCRGARPPSSSRRDPRQGDRAHPPARGVGTRRAELEREADARARTVVTDAEQYASRLRTDALTQVGELQEQAQRLATGSHPATAPERPEASQPAAAEDEASDAQGLSPGFRFAEHGVERATAFVEDLGPRQPETFS